MALCCDVMECFLSYHLSRLVFYEDNVVLLYNALKLLPLLTYSVAITQFIFHTSAAKAVSVLGN